jgi:hypothetical protein
MASSNKDGVQVHRHRDASVLAQQEGQHASLTSCAGRVNDHSVGSVTRAAGIGRTHLDPAVTHTDDLGRDGQADAASADGASGAPAPKRSFTGLREPWR